MANYLPKFLKALFRSSKNMNTPYKIQNNILHIKLKNFKQKANEIKDPVKRKLLLVKADQIDLHLRLVRKRVRTLSAIKKAFEKATSDMLRMRAKIYKQKADKTKNPVERNRLLALFTLTSLRVDY